LLRLDVVRRDAIRRCGIVGPLACGRFESHGPSVMQLLDSFVAARLTSSTWVAR
jgi:hypothetical protein